MNFTLTTLAALVLPALALIAASILACRRIAVLQRSSTRALDWNAELEVDRYRPMLRLLGDEDLRFLRAQPGATPVMVARLQQRRCQLFRAYLRSLEHDFRQASHALILVLIQSQIDRPDLIPALIGSQVKFALGVFQLRCRLLLYRWDVAQEPVARLVDLFEGLQSELRSRTPLPDGAGA
jgi:hypothetical protein